MDLLLMNFIQLLVVRLTLKQDADGISKNDLMRLFFN